jgi:N-acetylglucosamine-6-phosphate deacetylase
MTDARSTPGLFDLQVNGFAGVDFNDAAVSSADMDRALDAMLACGTTHCLPTIITAFAHELEARFCALDRAVSNARLGAKMVPGYHLEGPFLNPAAGYAGCHPPDAMIEADPALVERIEKQLERPILLITVAPEMRNVIPFIRWAVERGKVIAIGHSSADADCVARAADAGARLSTHLGNGIARQHDKFANPLFAQLGEDRLAASFIADGIHVPFPVLKVMLRARGVAQSILVTDAVAAAAAPMGSYRLAGMDVDRAADGSVRQKGGATLAGSALTLDQAVRNTLEQGLLDFDEAIALASKRPRDVMREAFVRHGISLMEGSTRWSEDLTVVETRLAGEVVFCR